jgi:hypothetical protein
MDSLEELQNAIDENKQKLWGIDNLKLNRALVTQINLEFFGSIITPEVGTTGRVFGIPYTVVEIDEPEWSFDCIKS